MIVPAWFFLSLPSAFGVMQTDKKFFPEFKIYSPDDLAKDWFIYWIVDGVRFKRKSGINRFKTFDERMAAALWLLADVEAAWQGIKPLDERLVAWVEDNRGKWRKKGFQTVRSKIDCFLRWVDGRRITNGLVREFFRDLMSRRHATTYVAYRRVLGRIFKGVGEAGLLDGVEDVKAVSTPAKYFQNYQVRRLERFLVERDAELWLFCRFIYFCFIRPGELRFMRVGDIEFDDWKICVRGEVAKNGKTQYVTIPVAFRDALRPLMDRSPNEFLFFKDDCTKPLAANAMLNRFRAVLSELGFGLEYKLYSWKHTGAVACWRAGANLKDLQLQLRHSSLDETDKYLRQLGVWDLGRLEEIFPAPGVEVVKLAA